MIERSARTMSRCRCVEPCQDVAGSRLTKTRCNYGSSAECSSSMSSDGWCERFIVLKLLVGRSNEAKFIPRLVFCPSLWRTSIVTRKVVTGRVRTKAVKSKSTSLSSKILKVQRSTLASSPSIADESPLLRIAKGLSQSLDIVSFLVNPLLLELNIISCVLDHFSVFLKNLMGNL